MKAIYKIPLLVGVLILSACTNDFEEINANKNFPETTTPELLFRNVLWEVADQNANDGWDYGNILAQQTTRHDFNDLDRYDRVNHDALWQTHYQQLRNLANMESLIAANSNYAVYEGPVKVIKAFIASKITDTWGDVPFFSAGLGDEGMLSPIYDMQEEIYTATDGILDLLESAVSDIANYNGGATLAGDIMYDGNLDNWIKLANSLRLRYLLRVNGQISDAASQMKSILDGGQFITSNAENAKVNYLAGAPNQWNFFLTRSGDYTLLLLTEPLEDMLKSWNDTERLIAMFKTAAGSGEFNGLVSGINETWKSENGFNVEDYSLLGSRYRDFPDVHEAVIINAAEVHFIIAEAIEMNLLNGTSDDYYNEGIRQAFDYLGLTATDSYLEQTTVDLNQSADRVQSILQQKWVANFGVGLENFFDLRRTDWGWLDVPVANVNGDRFPIRFLYPSSEQATNGENYQKAISRQGNDDINTAIWLTK